MSQHPPPPSFRRPFNPDHSSTPPSGAAQNVMSQFPHHPNYNSVPSVQYANPYGYNTTSQNMNGSLSVAGVPQALYGAAGKTTNGSFPPLSYPPTQSSYGVLPQTSTFAHLREPSLALMQPHNSLPQKPPPVAAMAVDVPTLSKKISELEDGELSDEFGRDRRETLATTGRVSQYSPNDDDELFSKNIQGDRERLAESADTLRDTLENGNQKLQGKELSNIQTSNHTPPSKKNHSTNQLEKSHGNSWDHLTMIVDPVSTSGHVPENTSDHKADNAAAVSTEVFPQENATRTAKLRDLAKDTLKEFYESGIGFSQIANEGIDPAMLCDLYSELGIPIPPNPTFGSKQATDVCRTGSGQEKIDPNHRDINNNTRIDGQHKPSCNGDSLEKSQEQAQNHQTPTDASDAPNPKTLSNQSSLNLKDQAKRLEKNSNEIDNHGRDARKVINPNNVLKPIQMAKPPKGAPANILNKATITKLGDKALERKDYIARMLAAKSSKSISVASTALPLQISADRETVSQPLLSKENRLVALEEGRCLQIKNLPAKATTGDLNKLFSAFSTETLSIPAPSPIAKSTGCGYAVLSSAVQAQGAITELSGKQNFNQKVSALLAPKSEGTMQTTKAALPAEDRPSAENFPDSGAKTDTDAEANKKAQTELARQKIEALKNRAIIARFNNDTNQRGLPSYLESGGESLPKVSQEEPAAAIQPTPVPQSKSTRPIFIPLSRKPAVTIPGLFMESTALEASTVLGRSEGELHTNEAQSKSEHARASELQGHPKNVPGKESDRPPVQPPTERDSGAPYTLSNPEARIEPPPINEPKRRQRAADFIDPPSVKARKLLGRNTDSSVIIEVSDNETIGDMEDNTDIEDDIAMDIDEDIFQSSPPKKPSSIASGSGKQKAIRDLPPLSDFPIRKKPVANVAAPTPPAAQTPSKSREPESLETKVKEIEVMNRRIAELEQRIKAKQIATRAETPGTPERSGSPKHKSRSEAGEMDNTASDQIEVGDLKDVAEAANLDENTAVVAAAETPRADEALRIAPQQHEHERILAEQRAEDLEQAKANAARIQAAEAAKAIEQERALAEQRAEDLKRAKVNAARIQAAEAAKAIEQERVLAEQRAEDAKADAERLRAVEAARAIEQERVLAEQRAENYKADDERLQAAEAARAIEHERLLAEQRAKDAELARADAERLQVAEVAREERVLAEQRAEDAKADAERLRAAEAARAIEQEHLLAEQRAKDAELAKADAERLEAAEAARAMEQEQEQERVLAEQHAKDLERAKVDAERIRAEELAETKRKLRLSEIESSLPILGAEIGKNRQELQSLEQKVEVLRNQVREGEEWERILLEERSELIFASKLSGENNKPTEMIDNVNQGQLRTEERNGPHLPDQGVDLAKVQQKTAVRCKGHGDSSPPQSRPSENFRGNSKVQHQIIDDQADLMEMSPNSPIGGAVVNEYSLGPLTSTRGGLIDPEEIYEPPEIPSHESKASIRSSRMADSSDSDDYEPPEPVSLVENPIPPHINASTNSVASVSDFAVNIDTVSRSVFGDSVYTVKDSVTADVTDSVGAELKSGVDIFPNPRVKKFTPYESPLKKFKSYRYHPEFLAEVPHGFRSMTFIHDIDSEKPVCRYELAGGVCNDDSCDGQHFRNMGLSDDTVLVQMGAVPPGLPENEAEAFRDGLRHLIHDIRERKVKDCSTVASEIAAYRAQFLGDKFKVLPL